MDNDTETFKIVRNTLLRRIGRIILKVRQIILTTEEGSLAKSAKYAKRQNRDRIGKE